LQLCVGRWTGKVRGKVGSPNRHTVGSGQCRPAGARHPMLPELARCTRTHLLFCLRLDQRALGDDLESVLGLALQRGAQEALGKPALESVWEENGLE